MSPVEIVALTLLRVAGRMAFQPHSWGEAVQDGRASAFIAGPDSAIIATLYRTGEASICAAAGRLPDLLRTLPQVEAFYRSRGARMLYVGGREGWERILPKYGYQLTLDRRLVKEL